MCIAIKQPRGLELSKSVLQKCWDNNPDGAGFMYASNGKIIVRKELDSFKSFYKQLSKHRKRNNVDFVIHFRIATHGMIDKRNTHPHRVNQSTWLVHNGVISQKCFNKSSLSDTVHFTKLLGKLPSNFMLNDSMLELIREYISTDKIIFLNDRGDVKIVNESHGVKKHGCWFSNHSFQKIAYAYSYQSRNYGSWQDYHYNSETNEYTTKEGHILGVDFELCNYCGDECEMKEHRELSGLCLECWEWQMNKEQSTATSKQTALI